MTTETSRTPVLDFIRIWTFFACLSVPPVLLLSFRALWASYLCLGLPAVWLAVRSRPKIVGNPQWLWLVPGLLFWIILTAQWSPSASASGASFELALVAFFALALFVAAPPQAWMLVMATLGALTLLSLDIGTGNFLRHVIPPDQAPGKDAVASARGLGLTLLMLPPTLLFMHRSGKGGGRWRGVVLLSGMMAGLSGVLAYGATLVSALIGGAIGGIRPALAWRALAGVWVGVMSAPFILVAALPPVSRLVENSSLPDSIVHRLIIWRTVLDLWLDGRVLTGAGARATHTLTDRLGDLTLASGVSLPQVSAHPHNIPIQLLYEFGLVGFAAVAALLLFAGRLLITAPWRKDMAMAIAALAAGAAVLVSVEADVWHVYFWCSLIMSIVGLRAVSLEAGR